jgi:hypothetical protein
MDRVPEILPGHEVMVLEVRGALGLHREAILPLELGADGFRPLLPVVAPHDVGPGIDADIPRRGVHVHDSPVPIEREKSIRHAFEQLQSMRARREPLAGFGGRVVALAGGSCHGGLRPSWTPPPSAATAICNGV